MVVTVPHPCHMFAAPTLSCPGFRSKALPESATYASISPVLAEQGVRQLEAVLRNLPKARSQARSQAETLAAAPSQQPTPLATTPAATEAPISDAVSAVSAPPAPAAPAAPAASPAPRIPKSAGQLLFGLHSPERLHRIWASLYGFTPLWSTFHGERIAIQHMWSPAEAEAKLREARTLAEQKAQAGGTTEASVAHFPSIAEAHNLGVGGLFFEPALQCVGVVCAGSTLERPQVLYVSQVQLAFKAAPVSAATFAQGYLDKRRVRKELHDTWKFLSSEEGPAGGKRLKEIDWWGPRLDKKSKNTAAANHGQK